MPVPKSRPVPAFYDCEQYPCPLLVLSSQAEMTYQPVSRMCVITTEEMALPELDIVSKGRAEKAPRERGEKTSKEKAPQAPREEKLIAFKAVRSDSEHSEGSPSPSESTLTSLSEDEGDKIPKPTGEAGRPGRGGYNLEEKLGWGSEGFKQLKVSSFSATLTLI